MGEGKVSAPLGDLRGQADEASAVFILCHLRSPSGRLDKSMEGGTLPGQARKWRAPLLFTFC